MELMIKHMAKVMKFFKKASFRLSRRPVVFIMYLVLLADEKKFCSVSKGDTVGKYKMESPVPVIVI